MRNKFKQQKSSQISLRCHKQRIYQLFQLFVTNKNGFVDYLYKAVVYCVGGVGGIRTHARGKPSNDLANRPLQPA